MLKRFAHSFKRLHGFLYSCILVLILCYPQLQAQSLILNYKVVQNNKIIGWIKLEKKDSGDAYRLLFDCETKKRVLVLITIIEKQQSCFRNGTLIQSSIYSKINNDVKMDKLTTYKTGYYEINNKRRLKQVQTSAINYNQLSMYFFEPANVNEFYSEHFDTRISIKKIENTCL